MYLKKEVRAPQPGIKRKGHPGGLAPACISAVSEKRDWEIMLHGMEKEVNERHSRVPNYQSIGQRLRNRKKSEKLTEETWGVLKRRLKMTECKKFKNRNEKSVSQSVNQSISQQEECALCTSQQLETTAFWSTL
ncbi:hypothetical protein RUM43_003505 [Polyplax serrata]|uniref:Uncharacterized protein n=1 Tax=Polyplax serrata TaxID=468196 RepID=A0AAN8PFM7_POLSC